MVASAFLRNSVSIGEWLTATTFVKYCTLKKLFSAIISTETMFLGTTTLRWITVFSYDSLLIISLRFLYICH